MKTSANVSNNRQTLYVLLAGSLLLMMAWGLWLWRLDASDLTFDETATYFVAHRPPLEILQYLRRAIREHPPVYYLLIRCWMTLAGTSEFSLRAFSVGAGMVALALTRWLGRLMGANKQQPAMATLIPIVLLTFVPGMAFYARDARMYSLGTAWTLLAAGLFLRDWLRPATPPRPWAVVALLAVHALALFTHYYLLFPILIQALALLLARRWRSLAIWCAAHVLPALGGLAWLGLSPGLQMTTESLAPHFDLSLPTSAQMMHLMGKLFFSPIMAVRYDVLYGLLALTAVGLLLALFRRWRVGVWMTLLLTLPLIFVYLIPHPPEPRFLVYQLPFVALALSSLCRWPLSFTPIRPWWQWIQRSAPGLLTLLVAGLLSVGGLHFSITFERSTYGQTLETVQTYAQPGDRLLFYGPWQWIQFYYYDPGDLPPITTLPECAPPHLDPAEAKPVLEDLLAQAQRLWVIPAAVDDVDPAHFVWRWLDAHAHRVQDEKAYRLYLPPLPAEAPSKNIRAPGGEKLQLERVAWEAENVQTGQPFRLTLHWPAERKSAHPLQIDLTLVDEAKHVWASTSLKRAPGETVSRAGWMIPWGAPPGVYHGRVTAIDRATGETIVKEVPIFSTTVSAAAAPAPDLHDLPHANAATFCAPDGAPCIQLAGYEPGGVRFQQGYPVPMTLHWLATEHDQAPPALDLQLQIAHLPALSLFGKAEPVVTRTLRLPPASIQRWKPGCLVTLPTALTLPPDAPTGPARVSLAVRANGVPWAMDGEDANRPAEARLDLFDVTVEGRPVQRQLPPGLTPVEIDLGEEVGLRGYRVQGEPRPGGQLRVIYAWYARTRPASIYAVFNHLVAPDGTIVAQVDSWPQGGRMLSIQWQAGEYVKDAYTLEIPPQAPPGPYTLYVGLYNAANDVRQPAYRDGQRLPDDRWAVPLPGEPGDE